MSNRKKRDEKIGTTDKQWLQLIERYFDATTTAAEEQHLRQFLASPLSDSHIYDEIKAVMGYLNAGKRYNAIHKKQKTRKTVSILKWSTAAAIAVGIFGTAALHFNNNDICVTYIDGKRYTEEAIVLAQMQSTMQRVSNGIEQHSLEHQLGNMFRTINYHENENK